MCRALTVMATQIKTGLVSVDGGGVGGFDDRHGEFISSLSKVLYGRQKRYEGEVEKTRQYKMCGGFKIEDKHEVNRIIENEQNNEKLQSSTRCE